jgi:hypothetical protein
MGLLDTDYATVSGKKPRKSDKMMPGTPMNARGLLDAATMIPIAGDALSGGLAVYDAAKGDYGSAALNALGMLPFLSAGMIKVAKPSKYGKFPDEIEALKADSGLGKNDLWQNYGDHAAMVKNNMDMTIHPLSNGDFALSHSPAWGNKSKAFYAVGDNPEELINYSLSRVEKSNKAIKSAEEKKYAKSLAGLLEAEYGPVFSYANSGRSASQYITHNPSGQKIRISDHDLPLGYVQTDHDVPIGLSDLDKLKSIMGFLK